MESFQHKNASFWRRWLTRWLISHLETGSVDIRTYILQILGKIGDETAFPVIVEATKDGNDSIRRFAVSALADTEDKKAIDVLVGSMDDKEVDIQAAAAAALGRFKGEKVENALIKKLMNNTEDSVKSQVIISLGNLGSKKALPMLNKMMKTESNEWIRRYISQAIKEIEGGLKS
ncbi:hypothetical protein GF312_16445 [Candidatus Poribacteria bacterium]|nr:hypothetical protein [Candidatus Poribacteria bacterium]